MKRLVYFSALMLHIGAFQAQAQDSTAVTDNRPVRDPWMSSYTIDNQTTLIPAPGVLEFNIVHRFSSIAQGTTDLFGFYGTSNVSLALSYGITKRFMLGFETEKDRKLQVFKAKLNLQEQTRSGSIPVSVALYGNTAISATPEHEWGTDYTFTDKLSYFSELIVSRKLTSYASALASLSYSHCNKVPGLRMQTQTDTTTTVWYVPEYQNDALAFSLAARTNVWKSFGLVAEYHHSMYLRSLETEQRKPKPSAAAGFEINTPSHVFQMFISSYQSIVPQYNYTMNQNDLTQKEGLMLGFNIFIKI